MVKKAHTFSLKNNTPYAIDHRLLMSDGRIKFVHERCETSCDRNGIPIHSVGTVQDITQKVKMQEEAVRTARFISLGELAAGVAHEINNPINSVINYAEILLEKYASGPKGAEIAGRIIKEGVRIAGIVKSLLSFARQGGEEKRPVRIEDVLFESLDLTEAMMRKNGINIELSLESNLPPVIANFQQIQQVFLNILSNAHYAVRRKYGAAGKGKRIKISLAIKLQDKVPFVQAAFLDDGIGIPDDIIHKVAEPFFTTKPAREGTGLGLSISHGIISDHKGTMAIESVEGDYTRVIISLPAMTTGKGNNEA
jgi:signal transduction histidine kinase